MKKNNPTSNAANLYRRVLFAILLACAGNAAFATTAYAEELWSANPESKPKLGEIGYPGASIDAESQRANPPSYPKAWAKDGITGMVVILISVNPDDSLFDVSIEKSSRHRELDASAIDAARRWRYRAGKLDGEAVFSKVRVPINFSP